MLAVELVELGRVTARVRGRFMREKRVGSVKCIVSVFNFACVCFLKKGRTYYLERKLKHFRFKILFLVPLALGAVENR